MSKNNRTPNQNMDALLNRISNEVRKAVADELSKRVDDTLRTLGTSYGTKVVDITTDTAEKIRAEVAKAVSDQLSRTKIVLPETLSAEAKLDSEDLDAIIRANREISNHTEEYIADRFKRLEELDRKERLDSVLKLIEVYERFLNVHNYYIAKNPGYLEEYDRMVNFRKYLEKELVKKQVTMGAYEVGARISDEGENEGDLRFVEIVNSNQCDDPEMWNTVKMIKDANYYEFEGEVIRKQRIVIFGKEDA